MSTAELTRAEVYARLTRPQKNTMQAIKSAKNEVTREESVLASRVAYWQVKVFEAVQAGVPVRFLATELGLSTSRIYQIRDEVIAHRVEQ